MKKPLLVTAFFGVILSNNIYPSVTYYGGLKITGYKFSGFIYDAVGSHYYLVEDGEIGFNNIKNGIGFDVGVLATVLCKFEFDNPDVVGYYGLGIYISSRVVPRVNIEAPKKDTGDLKTVLNNVVIDCSGSLISAAPISIGVTDFHIVDVY